MRNVIRVNRILRRLGNWTLTQKAMENLKIIFYPDIENFAFLLREAGMKGAKVGKILREMVKATDKAAKSFKKFGITMQYITQQEAEE